MRSNLEIPEFNDEEIKHGFLEVSKMSAMVPKHRLEYINSNFEQIKKVLEHKKIDLMLENATLSVLTNKKTRDPYILIKADEYINLIARGVDIDASRKVLEDKYTSEIVKISNLCKCQETFINRRNRLEGPNGNTIKAIKLITKTDIFVQGKTVCIIGEYKRVREAIEIVEGCFKNLHPVYMIKKLMVKRELEKDKEMENVDWKRFLPEVKSKIKNKRGDGKKKKANKENTGEESVEVGKEEGEVKQKKKANKENTGEESTEIGKEEVEGRQKKTNKKTKKIYEAPTE